MSRGKLKLFQFSELRLLLTLSVRNLWRNPRRSLLTLLAVVVGIWSSVCLAAMARGMAEQMAEDAILNFTGHIQIHAPGYLEDPVLQRRFSANANVLSALKSAEIVNWTPRIRVPAAVRSEREVFGITLLAIDPALERNASFLSKAISDGRYLTSDSDDGLILGRKMLDLLQTKIGRRVVLMSEGANGEVADRGFRIVGVFDAELEASEKGYAVIALKTGQEMLGIPGEISEVAVNLSDRGVVPDSASRLEKELPALDVKPWTAVQPLIAAMMDLQGGFLIIWFVIVMITISFGLINTLFMSIFERTREFGLTQALGMRPQLLVLQIAAESALLVAYGVLLGNALAGATLFVLRNGIDLASFGSATQFMGMSSVIYLYPYFSDWLWANGLIVVIGILGSIYPGWKAASVSPTLALSRG